MHSRLEAIYDCYRVERRDGLKDALPGRVSSLSDEDDDQGGNDTFFAWFFRGEGPKGVISGANIQQRFTQRGAVYATFFEDNHVMWLLGARPGNVLTKLADALGTSPAALRGDLQARAAQFLGKAKKHARGDRFEAYQAAAVELLKDHPGLSRSSPAWSGTNGTRRPGSPVAPW